MASRNLDVVGVQAVFEGFAEYLNKMSAFERANVAGAASVRKAATAQTGAAATATGFQKSLGGNQRQALQFALGMAGATTAIVAARAALGDTIGAAIAFEDSFAGIRKTVDATEAEFEALASANRKMARELPISVDAINRIGELGGALGVTGIQNIQKFERVVSDLANTTDLTAEAAATAVAQVANVFQIPIAESDRFGATLVDLGNKAAATESQITEYVLRIGAAGKISGLTVAEVAGIGTAFASVGIQSERGGTAIQKILIAITQAVATGNEKLEGFAKTAGLSADAFVQLFKADPAEAFTRFVEGLGLAGDQLFTILDDLEEADARTIGSFASVATAGDLLRKSIATGSTAYRENIALTTEAEKRYATTASQLKILRNNVRDVGISLGNETLPAINAVSGGMTDLLGSGDAVATVLGSAAKAALVFAGALAAIKLLSFVSQLNAASGAAATFRGALLGPAGIITAFAILGEVVSRAVFGQGLLDLFSNADEGAKRAAKSQLLYNDAIRQFSQLSENLGSAKGFEIGVKRQIDAIDVLFGKLEALQALRFEGNRELNDDSNTQFFGREIPGLKPLEEELARTFGSARQKAQDEFDQLETDVKARIKSIVEAMQSADVPVLAFKQFQDQVNALDAAGVASVNRLLDELNLTIEGIDVKTVADLGVAIDLLQSSAEQGAVKDALDALASGTLDAKQSEAAFRGLVEGGLLPAEVAWGKLSEGAKGAASSTEEATTAAERARESQKKLADAINLATDAFDGLDPVTEQLKLQILQLEQQKRAAEGAGQSTEKFDARLAVLNTTLESQQGKVAIAKQQVVLFAANLEASGLSAEAAEEAVARLGDELADLPLSKQIEIALALPELEITRLNRFLALWAQGIEIPIALAIASAPATQVSPEEQKRTFLPGLGAGGPLGGLPGADFAAENIKAAEQGLRDYAFALDKATRDADAASAAFAGAGSSVGGAAKDTTQAADRLTLVLGAVSDGVIDLAEATQLGLSDTEIVVLELEKARQQEADAAFRTRIEFEKLAQVLVNSGMTPAAFRLALGLKAIADHLAETGQTINEFLHEVATNAVDELGSALDKLFGGQTREDKEIELKLKNKELERSRRKRAGATDESLEGLDREIETIRETISIRREEKDIIKLKAELEDQSLISDRDQLQQSRLISIALRDESQKVKDLNGVLIFETLAHLNAANAANQVADAFRELAIQQQTAALNRGEVTSQQYFDQLPPDRRQALARLLEELHRQGKLASGGLVLGPTSAMLGENNRKELVLPLESPRTREILAALPAGLPSSSVIEATFSPNTTFVQAMDERQMRSQFHRWVDEMFGGARGRAIRAGAPLSGSIG